MDADARPAPHKTTTVALLRWAWALACILALLFLAFSGWLAKAAECGEGCDALSSAWNEDERAWQWTGQLAIVGIGVALYAASAVLALRRRGVWALATGALAITTHLAWASLVLPHVTTS